jgi:hypothetical protein
MSKKETTSKKTIKVKEYKLDTLKTPLTKEEHDAFNKLDEEGQKKFIITKWVQENRSLDTPDQHEVSLEDERFAGLRP